MNPQGRDSHVLTQERWGIGDNEIHAESTNNFRLPGVKSQSIEERFYPPQVWWPRGLDLPGGVKEVLSNQGRLVTNPESERTRIVKADGF